MSARSRDVLMRPASESRATPISGRGEIGRPYTRRRERSTIQAIGGSGENTIRIVPKLSPVQTISYPTPSSEAKSDVSYVWIHRYPHFVGGWCAEEIASMWTATSDRIFYTRSDIVMVVHGPDRETLLPPGRTTRRYDRVSVSETLGLNESLFGRHIQVGFRRLKEYHYLKQPRSPILTNHPRPQPFAQPQVKASSRTVAPWSRSFDCKRKSLYKDKRVNPKAKKLALSYDDIRDALTSYLEDQTVTREDQEVTSIGIANETDMYIHSNRSCRRRSNSYGNATFLSLPNNQIAFSRTHTTDSNIPDLSNIFSMYGYILERFLRLESHNQVFLVSNYTRSAHHTPTCIQCEATIFDFSIKIQRNQQVSRKRRLNRLQRQARFEELLSYGKLKIVVIRKDLSPAGATYDLDFPVPCWRKSM